jgi:superfamily II DNA or RNA helicase/HKD family nuclease
VEERQELIGAIELVRARILKTAKPDGWNIGFNDGAAAGQTVSHFHLHVIPRYAGDVSDPRGGVRLCIPSRGNYLSPPLKIVSKSVSASSVSFFDPGQFGGGNMARTTNSSQPTEGPTLTAGEQNSLFRPLTIDLASATEVDAAIAFVMESGLDCLEPHLQDILSRGGRIRFLTGDYQDITQPIALRRLLDLRLFARPPAALDLRVFVSGNQSFHPKSWVIRSPNGGVAWIGSSNISKSALQAGIEWNYRIITSHDTPGFESASRAFEELFKHPSVRPLDTAWVDAYEKRRRPPARSAAPWHPGKELSDDTISEAEPSPDAPTPNVIQARALDALQATRALGNQAGLVVLATGLGKTFLAAFDSVPFRRVLFVAHREEIREQARKSFRRVRPAASFGFYDGADRSTDADVLFASIQTLSKRSHLDQFPRDYFDYVVVDEFHHASAATYRRLLDHFVPRFLLGLTATPERTDGGDLLALCGENLVFRTDLPEGIDKGLLSPFHYFGVPDDVEYSNIPWRSSRFDEEALTTAVATQARAENILDQYRKHLGRRTLGFCVSQRHANFMSQYFRENGVRAVAVHSGADSGPRSKSLEALGLGELDVVFAVDMFNEGVDLPNVDLVMMLRPTESRLLWLQQLGRGLRVFKGKSHLTVLDYIGNHRTFLLKAQTLLEIGANSEIRTDSEIAAALKRLLAGDLTFPPGCEVTYDLAAVDILRGLLRVPKHDEALKNWYEEFRERLGARPKAVEALHDGYRPRSTRKAYGSWMRFCRAMGDLTPEEGAALDACGKFLDELDVTPMQKSYKMLVLQALLNLDAFPGEVGLDALGEEFARIARRSAALRADVGPDLDRPSALNSLIRANPIAAWAGTNAFRFADDRLTSMVPVPASTRAAFQGLVRELVDWRLAEYLANYRDEAIVGGGVGLRVSHAGGKPILFLDREKSPGIPLGWTALEIDDERFEANFVKVAVNVLRKPGSASNNLAGVLRRWFGPDAGLPGTDHHVSLTKEGDTWRLTPVLGARREAKLEVSRSYPREQIPTLFGLTFKPSLWQQGFIPFEDRKLIVLLVTLDKGNMQGKHQYKDRFIGADAFQWQSQNRTTQSGKHGQLIRNHAELGIHVHLFVRKESKSGQRAAPFSYRGEVRFESWEGEKPITVRWRLA